jgi:two-component system, NtrC family, sensor kinase
MASLFVIRGKDAGRHFTLEGERIVLGRDPHCDIPVADHEVSRQHAAIVFEDGQAVIEDLSSSNGTFVNGRRIVRHVLQASDRLQLGRSLLVYTTRTSDTSTETIFEVEIVPTENLEPSSSKELSQILRVMPTSATSNWDIMYRTVLAVSRTMDIDQLLQQILEFIFQGIACERGCVLLLDDDTMKLRPVVHRHRKPDLKSPRMEISQTILDYVTKNREGVLTSNAREDQRWNAGESIIGIGIREAICVPMLGRYGMVGAIYVDTSLSPGQYAQAQGKASFNEEHLKLMIAMGHQAALAVEDTFYYRGMVQAERLATMGQTIATLSHHIKNILQGINGGSYLVQEGLKRQQLETIAKGWKIVEKNQERISTLVMDMLTFSKERKPELKMIHLPDLIDDCLELIEPKAKEFHIEIEWNHPDVFPKLAADSEGIHRALLNVLTNAVDAVAEVAEPKISLRLLEQNNQAILEIHDNGPGIASDDLVRIFSLFESTKGSRGTGLGLPVSQKILREHEGDIQAISQLGGGSCFKLILPIRIVESEPIELLERPTELG